MVQEIKVLTRARRTMADESSYALDFVDYLNASLSPFHCVAEVKRRLVAAGFTELDERRVWTTIVPEGKYFVSRNGSSLIAFAVGGNFNSETSGFICVGAHTDSPCPKVSRKTLPTFTETSG